MVITMVMITGNAGAGRRGMLDSRDLRWLYPLDGEKLIFLGQRLAAFCLLNFLDEPALLAIAFC